MPDFIMLALFIPWILLILIVCFLICVIKRWVKIGFCISILLIATNWYWHIFAFDFRFPGESNNSRHLKVISWNISCSNSVSTERMEEILSVIKEQNPDVVFLTEYSRYYNARIDSVLCNLYPYKGWLPNETIQGEFYSHIPIDSCVKIGEKEDGSLLRCDLNIEDRSLGVYCLHMHSNNMVDGDLFYPDSIRGRYGVKRYLRNYEAAAEERKVQAKLIIDDFSGMPTIVMGDMNDVDGSPCMKVFADAGLRDAWWEGGFGYGATFHDPLPYRIDHILYSKGLILRSIKKVDANGLSDHDALVAEFEVEKQNSIRRLRMTD